MITSEESINKRGETEFKIWSTCDATTFFGYGKALVAIFMRKDEAVRAKAALEQCADLIHIWNTQLWCTPPGMARAKPSKELKKVIDKAMRLAGIKDT